LPWDPLIFSILFHKGTVLQIYLIGITFCAIHVIHDMLNFIYMVGNWRGDLSIKYGCGVLLIGSDISKYSYALSNWCLVWFASTHTKIDMQPLSHALRSTRPVNEGTCLNFQPVKMMRSELTFPLISHLQTIKAVSKIIDKKEIRCKWSLYGSTSSTSLIAAGKGSVHYVVFGLRGNLLQLFFWENSY